MKLLHPFNTQFFRNLSKKGHNSVNILRMTPKSELDLYFMMLYLSVNFEWNLCIPSKLSIGNQKCDNADAAADEDMAFFLSATQKQHGLV